MAKNGDQENKLREMLLTLNKAGLGIDIDTAMLNLVSDDPDPGYSRILHQLCERNLSKNIFECYGTYFDEKGSYKWFAEQIAILSSGAMPISGIEEKRVGDHPFMEISLSFRMAEESFNWDIGAGWIDTGVVMAFAYFFEKYVVDARLGYQCFPPDGSNFCFLGDFKRQRWI